MQKRQAESTFYFCFLFLTRGVGSKEQVMHKWVTDFIRKPVNSKYCTTFCVGTSAFKTAPWRDRGDRSTLQTSGEAEYMT